MWKNLTFHSIDGMDESRGTWAASVEDNGTSTINVLPVTGAFQSCLRCYFCIVQQACIYGLIFEFGVQFRLCRQYHALHSLCMKHVLRCCHHHKDLPHEEFLAVAFFYRCFLKDTSAANNQAKICPLIQMTCYTCFSAVFHSQK